LRERGGYYISKGEKRREGDLEESRSLGGDGFRQMGPCMAICRWGAPFDRSKERKIISERLERGFGPFDLGCPHPIRGVSAKSNGKKKERVSTIIKRHGEGER